MAQNKKTRETITNKVATQNQQGIYKDNHY